MRKPDADSVAGRVRAAVTAGGVRAWTTDDFEGLPARSVALTLNRLKDADELVSIRKGLYWRGRKYSFGMSRPDSAEVTAALIGDGGFGWAGLSASNALGLSTQVPAIDTIAVTCRIRDVPGIHYVTRGSRKRGSLNTVEVSILEVLNDWTDVIDVNPDTAARELAAFMTSPEVDAGAVAVAATSESPAARDRLSVVLRLAGLSELARQVRGSALPETRDRALAGIAA
jgi:hypothetical protein